MGCTRRTWRGSWLTIRTPRWGDSNSIHCSELRVSATVEVAGAVAARRVGPSVHRAPCPTRPSRRALKMAGLGGRGRAGSLAVRVGVGEQQLGTDGGIGVVRPAGRGERGRSLVHGCAAHNLPLQGATGRPTRLLSRGRRAASMTGLATSPGTEVEPTCSTRRAVSPRRPRMCADSRANSSGHAGSYSTRVTGELCGIRSPTVMLCRSSSLTREGSWLSILGRAHELLWCSATLRSKHCSDPGRVASNGPFAVVE